MKIPSEIAKAAKSRFESKSARAQRERLHDCIVKQRPLDAEPDVERRLRRIRAATGVGERTAEMLADYRMPARDLPPGPAKGAAEAIQGNSVDFLDVVFLEIARRAANAVARIIFRDGRPQGTGFLISDRLLITNNHVIGSKAEAGEFLAEFNYEVDDKRLARSVTRFELDSQTFFETDETDDLDFTVVALGRRVSGDGEIAKYGTIILRDSPDKHAIGEFVNVIQHPNGEFKKVSLHENRIVTRLDHVLHYITDTLPGSSGSPVLNLQCEAVALHHWGSPHRQVNYPDGRPVTQFANEGVRISSIVKDLRGRMAGMSSAKRALLTAALAGEGMIPESREGRLARPDHTQGGLVGGGSRRLAVDAPLIQSATVDADGTVNWSGAIPIQFSARIGPIDVLSATSRGNASVGGSAAGGVSGEKVTIDSNYSNRNGYKSKFLPGFEIPMPKLSASQRQNAARLTGNNAADAVELKYQHFSIVVSAKRRMPYFAACNIDGATWVDIDRDSGEPRESLESAEARETWFAEPRIDASAQCNDEDHYLHQSFRFFDRGHMVRRQDPAWGTSARAIRANADTFHFSNCVPQYYKFNELAKYWLGIENYVLDNAKAAGEKIVVFTGPVLDDDHDRPYRDIKVPAVFWKILVRVEDGELLVTALKADQSEFLKQLPESLGEAFDPIPAKIRQYQTSVRDIERLTGLSFGFLREHDTFVEGGDGEALKGGHELESFESITLTPKPRIRQVRGGRATQPARTQT